MPYQVFFKAMSGRGGGFGNHGIDKTYSTVEKAMAHVRYAQSVGNVGTWVIVETNDGIFRVERITGSGVDLARLRRE